MTFVCERTRQLKREVTAMCPYDSCDRNIPIDTDAYYEAIASQEEIYLEETEEELRMVLKSDDSLPLPTESVNQQPPRTAIPSSSHAGSTTRTSISVVAKNASGTLTHSAVLNLLVK